MARIVFACVYNGGKVTEPGKASSADNQPAASLHGRRAGSDTRSRRRRPDPRLRSEPTSSFVEARSWSHWGATRGAVWCPVRREDRRLEDPKGKPLEALCRTWDGESCGSSHSAPSARDRREP